MPASVCHQTTSHLRWFIVVAGAGAGLLTWAVSDFGVGLSPDSVAYISTARNMMTGHGLFTYDGTPFVNRPPLFPGLLALLGLAGLDPRTAAGYVNAMAFGFVIAIIAARLGKVLVWRPLHWVGAVAILFSQPLWKINGYAWSEPLFILVLVISLVTLDQYFNKRQLWMLMSSAACLALACLTRYLGITAVLSGTALIILSADEPLKRRLRHAIGFAAVALLPVAIWILVNFLAYGILPGQRGAPAYPLLKNLGYTIGSLSEWFLPSALGVALLLIARRSTWRIPGNLWRHNRSLATFTVVYLTHILAAASLANLDRIGDRLLSPVFVPLLVLILSAVDRTGCPSDSHAAPLHRRFLMAAGCVLWLLYPAYQTTETVLRYRQNGVGGYATRVWMESRLWADLREHVPLGPTYTNAPDAIYIQTGLRAEFSPFAVSDRSLYPQRRGWSGDLQQFQNRVQANSLVYLVWFNPVERHYLYSARELGRICALDTIATYPLGTIYRVRPNAAEPDSSTTHR